MTELNQVLSFEGLAINASGKVYAVNKATTINEARQRANRLKELLKNRNAHHDIFKYCNNEINAENYFHCLKQLRAYLIRLEVKRDS